jgi:hypothetical protein
VVVAGRLELAAVRRQEAARAARAAERSLAAEDPDAHLLASPQHNAIHDIEEIEAIAFSEHLNSTAEIPSARGGFTGLIYDRDAQMWVRWQDGRPLPAYERPT